MPHFDLGTFARQRCIEIASVIIANFNYQKQHLGFQNTYLSGKA
jgi:hypothetical protein